MTFLYILEVAQKDGRIIWPEKEVIKEGRITVKEAKKIQNILYTLGEEEAYKEFRGKFRGEDQNGEE